ncbi:hypothetical protein [Piscinibacter sp. XHJ-5]|uniref:hypothetical protein n=1 Tax=Piscinibacter sp. XHJ-5 TaxID=3037797 RepID=UPI00245281AE|nr:hypothetical protein [Piscinibacter sp. XHJ-5]
MATRQLPTKPQGDAATVPLRGKGPAKGERAPVTKAAKGTKVKAPVDAATKRAAGEQAKRKTAGRAAPPDLGDQQPVRARGKPAQRYVRLRVRVEDGELSIVDSQIVEGPLAQSATFEGGYAYEVTDGDRLLHAGSIPDLGVVRSFAHPDGTPEQMRHHTYSLSTYEFNARVPVDALKRASLSKTAVVLYRVKERPSTRAALAPPLFAAPLGEQRERAMREIGRVVGLPPSVLR